MKWKNFLSVIVVLLFALFLTGCWDKQELGEIAVVLGVGIDATADGQLELSVEIAHQSSSTENGESMIFSSTGVDWVTAEEGLCQQLDKQLFWGEIAVLIWGESLERTQRDKLILELYADSRLSSALLMMETQGRAAEVMHGKFGEATYVSQGLAAAAEKNEAKGEIYLLSDGVEQLVGMANLRYMPQVTVDKQGQISLKGEGNRYVD